MPAQTGFSIPVSRFAAATLGLMALALSSQGHARDGQGATGASSADSVWLVKNLGPSINTEYHDGWATITGDGLTLYFASNRPGGTAPANVEDGWYIGKNGAPTRYSMYVSHRATRNSPWGAPKLLPRGVNSEHSDHSAFESADGHWLFFASDRPGGCGGLDLYVSYRKDIKDDMAWEPPLNLGCATDGGPNGPGIESCPIYEGQGHMYFTSAPDANPANLDFKRASFDPSTRKASAVQTLSISTPHMDAHIDPRHGHVWGVYPGGVGGGDIWQFEPTGDPAQWKSPARLLPAPINTEYEDQIPALSRDGQILTFVSDRPGGEGGMDIYEATRAHE